MKKYRAEIKFTKGNVLDQMDVEAESEEKAIKLILEMADGATCEITSIGEVPA